MGLTPRMVAEDASFHAFINCYLREVDGGQWYGHDDWCSQSGLPVSVQGTEVLEVLLPSVQLRVLMDVAYRSKVGRHHFYAVYQSTYLKDGISCNDQTANWQKADLMYLLIAFVREIYQSQLKIVNSAGSSTFLESLKLNEMELLARVVNSYQLMARYLEARSNDVALDSFEFIDTEQSSLLGHWLHPTPKSRQGIAFWQQEHYTPELRGQFKLHYFSVARHLVIEGSVLPQATSKILFNELAKYERVDQVEGHVLIPVHPLQAHWLLLQDWVRALLAHGNMIYLGEKGADYTPTSSVRTLFNADSEWMLKFSIPVKITNSLRSNMRDELEDGMAVERYLHKSGFLADRPQFKIVDDPGYISVNMPGAEDRESGFEVVLRRNLVAARDAEGVCSVLSLVQAPIDVSLSQSGDTLLKRLVQRLAKEEQRSQREVAIDWFTAYWQCAVESLIVLYDSYGIALEAHQQNSLLDVSKGYPSCYYYRDNQGFYLSRLYSDALYEIDDMLTMSEMFYDDDKIFCAISYYVFVNQLFAVIYRLGADGLVEEEALLSLCRQFLRNLQAQMQGVGKDFIDYILKSEQLFSKTNLLARIHDIDELQEGGEHLVYSTIDNPLCCTAPVASDPSTDRKEGCDAAYAYS